jgi:hypothetical protein
MQMQHACHTYAIHATQVSARSAHALDHDQELLHILFYFDKN